MLCFDGTFLWNRAGSICSTQNTLVATCHLANGKVPQNATVTSPGTLDHAPVLVQVDALPDPKRQPPMLDGHRETCPHE